LLKFQIPNHKFQWFDYTHHWHSSEVEVPNPKQIPITKIPVYKTEDILVIRLLRFGIYLEFVPNVVTAIV
jgi:hypothetical protein